CWRPARPPVAGAPLTLVLAGAALWQAPIESQSASRQPASAANPRTLDGHPDFQGTYDLATLTPLERPAALGNKLTFTRQEVAALEKQAADRRVRADQPLDKNRAAPPIGGDGSPGAAGNVGGYNNLWIDNRTPSVRADGKP